MAAEWVVVDALAKNTPAVTENVCAGPSKRRELPRRCDWPSISETGNVTWCVPCRPGVADQSFDVADSVSGGRMCDAGADVRRAASANTTSTPRGLVWKA